jgi:opacity protein-like surface antigen
MFNRLFALGCLALSMHAASSAAAMDQHAHAERYLDVQRCMERTIGKQWQDRFGVQVVRNRWGVEEASALSMDTAPQIVRVTDLLCRRLSNLEGQPRP